MIRELDIKKFRNIEDKKIFLGRNLTVISGQNGLGKSTLLGLIGQGYSFYGEKFFGGIENKASDIPNLEKYKDIYGKPFETVYSDILNLSEKYDHPDYDPIKKGIDTDISLKNQYYYSVLHYESNRDFSVYSKDRGKDSNSIRLVTSEIGKKTHLPMAKSMFPTKYLGLNRVFPIVELGTSDTSIRASSFTSQEREYFNMWKNYILLLEEEYKEEILTNKKINKTVVSTVNYDNKSISIGQDNIGKIISIILSFKRLKESMGRDYKGGILLIDELEVSLFPAAIYNLLNYLYTESVSLKLQIIFTTHSLDLLKYLFLNSEKYDLNNKTKIIYLRKRNNKIQIENDYDYKKILTDLNQLVEKDMKKEKITLYFEDKEAELLFKKLVGTKIFSYFNTIPDLTLGCGNYIKLYNHNFPEILNNIIILDGDATESLNASLASGRMKEKPKNFILLPGVNPENLFYEFLLKLDDSHEFWTDKYTRQMFLSNYREKVQIPLNRDSSLKLRDIIKKWFNEEKMNWGKREISTLYNHWKKDNEEIVKSFNNEFKTTVLELVRKLNLDIEIVW